MPPPTTSQSICSPPSTTTHYHPPPAKIYPPPPTTTHHQPQYIHHHPPPPKKWTTTQQKPKYSNIAPFDIVLTVSFSSKCNISVMEILCDKVLISSFFRFKISTTFYVFKIFWSLYFNSLRLLNTNRVSNQKRPITIFI